MVCQCTWGDGLPFDDQGIKESSNHPIIESATASGPTSSWCPGAMARAEVGGRHWDIEQKKLLQMDIHVFFFVVKKKMVATFLHVGFFAWFFLVKTKTFGKVATELYGASPPHFVASHREAPCPSQRGCLQISWPISWNPGPQKQFDWKFLQVFIRIYTFNWKQRNQSSLVCLEIGTNTWPGRNERQYSCWTIAGWFNPEIFFWNKTWNQSNNKNHVDPTICVCVKWTYFYIGIYIGSWYNLRYLYMSTYTTQKTYPPSSTQELQGLTELDFCSCFGLTFLRTRWLIKIMMTLHMTNKTTWNIYQNYTKYTVNKQHLKKTTKKIKKTHTLRTLHWMVFAEKCRIQAFQLCLDASCIEVNSVWTFTSVHWWDAAPKNETSM